MMEPEQVISPQQRWRLREVIHKDGDWSLTRGDWKDEEDRWDRNVLAIRWNGNEKRPKGFPISSGYPVWFILPEELCDAVRSVVLQKKLKAKITQVLNTLSQEDTHHIWSGDDGRIKAAVSSFVEKHCFPRPYDLPSSPLEDLPNLLKAAITSVSSDLAVSLVGSDDLMDQICDQLAEWINANYDFE